MNLKSSVLKTMPQPEKIPTTYGAGAAIGLRCTIILSGSTTKPCTISQLILKSSVLKTMPKAEGNFAQWEIP
jgi:hypothetical protein